jgi:pseudouridine-5'-phosphate glycosidase
MIVAHMAGIQVFATGGIGGVHRGHPFDVSADLIELGRTSVAVVCSGAKSLLDLPLTMEALETQGVPVVGFGTDTLPAFYSRSSSLRVDVRVNSPDEAAQIIRAVHALEAKHGILVVVPAPVEQAFDANEAEAAIAQATREADEQNVQGKLLTPFVLKRVAEITGGKATTANRALLVNNARIAARIAVALCSS